MKILLVAPQPFYQERGTPMAVRILAESLCEFGHEVDLLVYPLGQDISIPGMRLLRSGRPPGVRHVPIGISWQKLACDVWLITRMIGLLLTNRYDVVHAVEEAVFPAVVLSLFSRRKLVYDMDSALAEQMTDKWTFLRPLRPLLQFIESMAVRKCTVVLPVCEDLADKVRPWTDPHRVVVLPDVPVGGDQAGETESLRDTVGAEKGAIIGLYVGNLEHYQGIDVLVDAMARLPRDVNLRMIVVGGTAVDLAAYRQRVRDLGVADRVNLIGPRPVANLSALLAQADILVSPRTLGQNTPMKVYSYMQAGKAILATDIRSHTQALDSDCAELIPAEPSALASGLARLAGDDALRRRLGGAARAKAEREYSRAAFRQRLQSAYAMLAAS